MDINKVVSGLSGSGLLGGLAGGALSGALMGNKKARKTAGALLKVGGVAALGGLAWRAYQQYQANQGPGGRSELPGAGESGRRDPVWQGLSRESFQLESGPGSGSQGLLLVQAMAAAANADGHVDSDERQRILRRAESLVLAPDEKAIVFEVLQNPLTLAGLCERVDCAELAAEVYLASLMAMNYKTSAARLYLDALAFRLGLPQALVAQLHVTVEDLEKEEGSAAA